MHIKATNLIYPKQAPYTFNSGVAGADPRSLACYLGAFYNGKAIPSHYTRQYEKAQRLQRMAERARKDRSRRVED